MTLRVVVTGGRTFSDESLVVRALGYLHQTYSVDPVGYGTAQGYE